MFGIFRKKQKHSLKRLTEKEIQKKLSYAGSESNDLIDSFNKKSFETDTSNEENEFKKLRFFEKENLKLMPNILSKKVIALFLLCFGIVGIIFIIFKSIPKMRYTEKFSSNKSASTQESSKPYTIQVAVFNKEEDAKALSIYLISKGYQATFVNTSPQNKKPYYYVYIGEFSEKIAAQLYLDKFRKEEQKFKDSFIQKRR